MSDLFEKFNLEHKGMLQSDRVALSPSSDSVKVSGHTFEDLLRRSAEFAKSLVFYADDNTPDGDWTAFFRSVYDYDGGRVRTDVVEDMIRTSSVSPHLALMFGFFKMLLVEQTDINKLTDRQMDYYFREVLGFGMRKAEEGKVSVFLELNNNARTVSIPKGLLFEAGKDAAGKLVTYETEEELVLGRDEVSLLAGYSDSNGFILSEQGSEDRTHSICIGSPVLNNPGCDMTVKFSGMPYCSGVEVEYSSVEGWTPAEVDDSGGSVVIKKDMPAICVLNPDLHGNGPAVDTPVIRFVSRGGYGVFSKIWLPGLKTVTVVVADAEPLMIKNKYGPVENRAGVNPFGPDCNKDDWFKVVLPFASSDAIVTHAMNVRSIIKEDPSDKMLFRISNDNCNQEIVSKEYSKKLIGIMKKENATQKEIDEVFNSRLIAVSPKLMSPVRIKKASYVGKVVSLFLQHPCGVTDLKDYYELPDIFFAGTGNSALYLGLSGFSLDKGQLSIRFTTSGKLIDPAEVSWSYLGADGWKEFGKSNILKDSSNGLSKDGVVVFNCNEFIAPCTSLLMGGYSWIRGICNNKNALEIKAARSRALELVISPSSVGRGPQGAPLPSGTISKTVKSVTGIKKVQQPFSGSEGVLAEQESLFSRRVAEHLRHKNRAWSVWDYESIILDRFSSVAYVKCLPACDGNGLECPGNVTICVIPNVDRNELRPGIGAQLLSDISAVLKGQCSSFAKFNVVSPKYLEVKIKAELSLRAGFNDITKYSALASDALVDYLKPWTVVGDGQHFRDGDGVSDVIAFLESLPYVDYIESISVFVDNRQVQMDGRIQLDNPLEVLTSAPGHEISCSLK